MTARTRVSTEQVNLRLPRVIIERAIALAIEDGRHRADVMREALLRGLRVLEAEAVARRPVA